MLFSATMPAILANFTRASLREHTPPLCIPPAVFPPLLTSRTDINSLYSQDAPLSSQRRVNPREEQRRAVAWQVICVGLTRYKIGNNNCV